MPKTSPTARNRSCHVRQYFSKRCGSADAPVNSWTSQKPMTPRRSNLFSGLPRMRRHNGTESVPRRTFRSCIHRPASPLNAFPEISAKIAFFASHKLHIRVDVTGLPVWPASNWGSTPELRKVLVLPLPSGPIRRYQGRRYSGVDVRFAAYAGAFASAAFASAIRAASAASSS